MCCLSTSIPHSLSVQLEVKHQPPIMQTCFRASKQKWCQFPFMLSASHWPQAAGLLSHTGSPPRLSTYSRFPCAIHKHLSKVCWQDTKGFLSVNKSFQKCPVLDFVFQCGVYFKTRLHLLHALLLDFLYLITKTIPYRITVQNSRKFYFKPETTRCNWMTIEHTMTLAQGS